MTGDARSIAWLDRVLSLAPEERRAVGWSFLCFFSILSAYFLLRPVRDEMAILAGPENIPDLFLGTFTAVLLLVPVFGWVTKRFPRRRFMPAIFAFCALNLVVFYAAFNSETISRVWTARAFFVWLSVFNMFVVSLFWSFMADLYSREQGQRLFGLITSGGSLGAILGPLATANLVRDIGIETLFLVSAALLGLTVFTIVKLLNWARHNVHDAHPINEAKPIGGSVLEGIVLVARTPFLLGIAFVILLGVFCGTAMYLYQAQMLAEHLPESVARTELLGWMDASINTLSLILQAFVARHAIRKLGVAATLSILPLMSVIAFAAIAMMPSLGLLIVIQVLRRATNFGLNGPARENLWTVVSAHSKYKAKNFLDVTLVRGADVVSSQTVRLLQSVFAAFAPIAWICAGICAVWLTVALTVGRVYQRLYDASGMADAAALTPGPEEKPVTPA